MIPELLSIEDFCKLTRMGKTRAYQLIADGEIKAVKNGKLTRIKREAMRDWISSLPEYSQNSEG